MKKIDYYKEFDKISNDLFEQLKKEYFDLTNNARDWETACSHLRETILNPKIGENGRELMALGTTSNFSKEWNQRYQLSKKERPEIFNEMIYEIELTKRDETVNLLGTQHGLVAMNIFLGDESDKQNNFRPGNESIESYKEYQSPLNWKGTNETEFVQFVYALHEAGYLKNETKEITTLVRQMAEVFNFSLGEHWQSNFSKSINTRNQDYKPKIFAELERAFLTYRDTQINKKKKN